MKKILCLILTVALLIGCVPALAADGLKEVVCEEMKFTTKIAADQEASFDTENGLWISIEKPGYIPFVLVYRRPLDAKFSNPVDALNNSYREYMENKYGENMVGTIPCDTYEVGGKNLYAAQYFYTVQGTQVCLIRLIEIRDDGDVEYSAKFTQEYREATLQALDNAVRYYEVIPEKEPEPETKPAEPESGSEVLEKTDVAGLIDTHCEEEKFSTKIPTGATGTWDANDGCFYVWLTQEGYVPNIFIVRRTGDDKFKNAENYLKTTYPNYMEKTYGDRLVGTVLHEYYDIGGKRLLATSFIYRNTSGYAINQIVLVELRDDGDVEYVVRFPNSGRDDALAALDAVVRYYQPD